MLYKCANPACHELFRHLGQGRLFQIESEYLEAPAQAQRAARRKLRNSRRVERYWLCDTCSRAFTLTFSATHEVVTIPLAESIRQKIMLPVDLPKIRRTQLSPTITGGAWNG